MAQQNAKYTSREIQKNLISCCRDLVVEKLLAEVKESKYYTILGDEATDCSLKEQIALVLRFVDKSSTNTIREQFVSYLESSYGFISLSLLKTINLDLGGLFRGLL